MPSRLTVSAALLSVSAFLAGCSASFAPTSLAPAAPGVAISGAAHGGRQPIYQAHIYLLEANTKAYAGPGLAADDSNTATNNASKSLLTTGDGTDSIGTYVLTAKDGTFSVSSDYSCDTGAQVYLYSLGGEPDGVNANPNAGLMAVLGTCGSDFSAATTVNMNELSTIAAGYAIAGFATDATHVGAPSSTDALAATGIKNAFANANQLYNISSNPYVGSVARTTTPHGNGAVPQQQIHTLANILSACINSTTSGTQCSTLFNGLKSTGTTGNTATDTASEAIYLAHNPSITSIYSITGSGAQPYSPWYNAVAPTDWNIMVEFTDARLTRPYGIAIDNSGNAWVTNYNSGTPAVVNLSNLGAPLSGSPYTGTGISDPVYTAIDSQGNPWFVNSGGTSPNKIDLSTTPATVKVIGSGSGFNLAIGLADNVWLSSAGLSDYSSGGTLLHSVSDASGNFPGGEAIAIDGSGDVWTSATQGSTPGVFKYSSSGTLLSTTIYTTSGFSDAYSIALDHSGNAWVADPDGNELVLFGNDGTPNAASPIHLGAKPYYITIDGNGNAWVSIAGGVAEVSPAGSVISPSGGLVNNIGGTDCIAIDGSGDVWFTGDSENSVFGVFEIIGASTPVTTPIAVGSQTNKLGARP